MPPVAALVPRQNTTVTLFETRMTRKHNTRTILKQRLTYTEHTKYVSKTIIVCARTTQAFSKISTTYAALCDLPGRAVEVLIIEMVFELSTARGTLCAYNVKQG